MKDGWVKAIQHSTITIADAAGDDPCYGWDYTHLGNFQVQVGDFVKAGTWIGEIDFHGLPHIHLARVFSEGGYWGKWSYICMPNGYFEYIDEEPPIIQKPFYFFQNRTDTLIRSDPSDHVTLSGDVDIVVAVREAGLYAHSNESGFGDRLSPARIDYEIAPARLGKKTVHRFPSFDFKKLKIRKGFFDKSYSSELTKVVFKHWTLFEEQRSGGNRTFSYYIITNCPKAGSPDELRIQDRDHGWDTQALDEEGNPLFPDGDYDVTVTAHDFAGNRSSEVMRIRVANDS
jgi:hypothetical protein